MKTYQIEVTDTFGGEANYSWVRRYTVKAKSFRGAAIHLGKNEGLRFRMQIYCGDYRQYKADNACICAFITELE